MVVEPGHQERELAPEPSGVSAAAVDAFAAASRRLAEGATLDEALAAIAEATASATAADVVVVRVADPAGDTLTARGVSAGSPALAAELEGSRLPAAELAPEEVDEAAGLPEAVRRVAERIGAAGVLQIPLHRGGQPLGSIELMRSRRPFDAGERLLARLAVNHLSLAVRAFAAEVGGGDARPTGDRALELAGDALAAGSYEGRTADQLARLAATVTRAVHCLLWRGGPGEAPSLAASYGVADEPPDLPAAREAVVRALPARRPVLLESGVAGPPEGGEVAATIRLGEPALGALQLFFTADAAPSDAVLAQLATFGVRAAHALRSSEKAQTITMELERTRALLAVVGQAIAQLSLAHTLETAVDNVAELLGTERVAVYLREQGRLLAAAGRALAGPHARVAERLLELALGPFRGRGMLLVEDAAADDRLAGVEEAVAEAGIEAALAVPLLVQDDVIGLLALYPARGRSLTANESALVGALASQLAVAVQNARLHEEAKRLGAELEQVLSSERQAARQLRALYEISRSFAQTLSLETTLDAVAQTVVELLDVDAAVIRMPDERREMLVTRAIHVADPRLGEAARAILSRPQLLAKLPGQRLLRMGTPLVLDAESAGELGASYELLVPFFEMGSTAVVVPVATPAEVLATLTILSLDPARAIGEETIEAAVSIAGQAALAIDNARLYQQQKDFADTMQRSLLPRSLPRIAGVEVGHVYESSARVDVGGDLYDFLPLGDGRLAVVLGDVTGHGIDATADMAMAKFVFRSLAREHPAPSDFLAAANEIVAGEIGPGKFITMAYLTIDARSGEVAFASAGHPAPRLVRADGTPAPLVAGGLPLGIESGQSYPEVRAPVEAGGSVVLYTDGVIEARSGVELYGEERLDALLSSRHALSAEELALAVLADCRSFAGGELTDDCAVVVLKRTE